METLFADENILRFQIAMKDFTSMAKLETSKQLEKKELGVVRVDPAERRQERRRHSAVGIQTWVGG